MGCVSLVCEIVLIFFRGSLSEAERKCYTDAVFCLQTLPSLLDPIEVPGAKSRYDGQ